MPKVDVTISINGDAATVVKVATGIAVALSQLAPEDRREKAAAQIVDQLKKLAAPKRKRKVAR